MLQPYKRFKLRLAETRRDAAVRREVLRLAEDIARQAPQDAAFAPVVVFNASTRLTRLSLNAAFSLITSWGLRLQGVPVIHFACRAGMSPCVLGTRPQNPAAPPPCEGCIRESKMLYKGADVRWFINNQQPALEAAIQDLPLDQLENFEWEGRSLGRLVLASIRWILRRHHLEGEPAAVELFKRYILSANNIAIQFAALLEEAKPQSVLVFNGMFYPEAAARQEALSRGIRVVAHEVALQPFSAFFTPGEATAYPIELDAGFSLTPEQEARLDEYLEQRFHGNFSMSGIRFCPEIQPLGEKFWQKASAFNQVVPVFTNVVFDTSQGHANVIFPHMFAWLDQVHALAKTHPDTYFVIRAHPDEERPGKESRESVRDWVTASGIDRLSNVLFVEPQEYFSSYELIQRAKFVMIYNSTIGLEAAILGAPVLSGGKARFTQLPTVYLPESKEEFCRMAEEFLNAAKVTPPAEFRQNARRFLYVQLFQTSLPFDDWLEEDGVWPGFVALEPFGWRSLLHETSQTMQIILDGMLSSKPFLRPI